MHLNLLCNASSVFKAACATDRFQEGKEEPMQLVVDDDIDAVGRLVEWLYSKTYTISAFDTEEHANERFQQLARLNTLAEKYHIKALSQNIITRMWEPHLKKRRIPPYPPRMSLVAYVYNNTSERSPFRKMMVAWYTWGIPMRWYEDEETRDSLLYISQEFSVDLVIALGQKNAFPDRQRPFDVPKELYCEDPRMYAIESEDEVECEDNY